MTQPPPSAMAAPEAPVADEPFGTNEMRLNGRHWLWVLALVGLVVLLTPQVWRRVEHFGLGPDDRLPYALSKDYWLYGQCLRQAALSHRIVVLGDSVVWGEYVLPDGTLSHFLNHEAGEPDRFVNGGVNGFFPLALEGLIHYYGQALRHQRVVLQCNVLWMTSPKADLSTTKEEPFNHARLVPQFRPRVPCYRATANERLSAVVERQVDFLAWVSHLQNTCFGQMSLPQWTLAEAGGDPPRYPNLHRNPLAQITLRLPPAPAQDPERGPASPRHKPWSTTGEGTTRFDWVQPDTSLQWGAFQRVIKVLRERDNEVFVILGPFNEHMLAEDNRPAYRNLQAQIASWLAVNQIPFLAPDTLPSLLCADASHPLTDGYALLAKRLYGAEPFQNWLKSSPKLIDRNTP